MNLTEGITFDTNSSSRTLCLYIFQSSMVTIDMLRRDENYLTEESIAGTMIIAMHFMYSEVIFYKLKKLVKEGNARQVLFKNLNEEIIEDYKK